MARAEVDALVLQMSADISRMEKALRKMAGETDRRTREVENRFNRMNAHIKRSNDMMARDLQASFAAIGVGAALGQVNKYADSWTTAQNKIAAAGVEHGRLAGTMRDLVSVAKETGSSFDATADLYAKVQRNAEKLGLTQQQILGVTRTVNQAFVAGGAAASEQASGILQLGQALGSGVLQGEELKAIRENAPLLAQAIADEFKTTMAGLKELGAQGVLTSDRVAKAILNATTIQEQFGRTTRTVAQATENLRTEFTRYIAESKTAQTVTQAFSGFLQFVTKNMDSLADAAIVAASVLGGTLAVAAIGRLLMSLANLRKDLRDVQTAFQGLRVAASFLGGPVGASILAIGTGLLYMANQAAAGQSAIDDLASSLAEYRELQGQIRSDTDKLVQAQKVLANAMIGVGDVAVSVANREVDAIDRRVRANKKLAESQRGQLQVKLNEARKEAQSRSTAGKGSRIDQFVGLLTEPFRESKVEDMTTGEIRSLMERQLSNRNMTRDQFRTFASTTLMAGRTLNNDDSWTNALVAAIDEAEAKVTGLETELADLEGAISKMGDTSQTTTTSIVAGTAAVSGYQTSLEKLKAVLDPLRKAHADDAASLAEATSAYRAHEAFVDAIADDRTYLRKQEADLEAQRATASKAEAARSRVALQALLEFVGGTDDLARTMAALPSLTDVLTRGDHQILADELKRQSDALTEAVLVGEDKIQHEFSERMKQIAAARGAAILQGKQDLAAFDRAVDDAYKTMNEGRMKVWDEKFPITGVRDLSDMVDQVGGDQAMAKMIQGIKDEWVRNGFIPSDAQIEMRETMRQSVKEAFREGVRTGDWGDSFASILADALTSALDKSLDRVGDLIADALFGTNGNKGVFDYLGSALASAAGIPIAGARANGGPVLPGRNYLVGENGPEILRMGGTGGQVLNAAQFNRQIASRPGGGGQTVINANLVVQGSVDAATLPKVEAMMRAQALQIMSAVPNVVNATLIDNRAQQRRF